MTFQANGENETYVAVDEGVLVKTGAEVLVSVRNAIGGTELDTLRGAVRDEFFGSAHTRAEYAPRDGNHGKRLYSASRGILSWLIHQGKNRWMTSRS